MQSQIARSLGERPGPSNDARHLIANGAQRYRYGDGKHLDIEDVCASERTAVGQDGHAEQEVR